MGNAGAAALGFLRGTVGHFVRDGAGEDDQQVRAAQFFLHRRLFGEYLGTAAIVFADIAVSALHTFISADDHDAHFDAPFLLVLTNFQI